jgi:hypothetical protein
MIGLTEHILSSTKTINKYTEEELTNFTSVLNDYIHSNDMDEYFSSKHVQIFLYNNMTRYNLVLRIAFSAFAGAGEDPVHFDVSLSDINCTIDSSMEDVMQGIKLRLMEELMES